MISAVRIAVIGLFVQGVGGLCWWGMLGLFPQTQLWFLAPDAPPVTLLAFAFPDLPIFVLGSFALAIGVALQKRWSWPGLLGLTGAVLYATLYCWGLWFLTAAALSGAVLMTLSSVQMLALVAMLKPKSDADLIRSADHKICLSTESAL